MAEEAAAAAAAAALAAANNNNLPPAVDNVIPVNLNIGGPPQPGANNDGNIGAIVEKVELPDFVEENTDLWFWQVEAMFESAGLVPRGNINQQNSIDKKRYMTIIGQLPTRIMYKLSDLRTTPPPAGTMYTTLKDRISTEFSDSTATKITKLLGEMSILAIADQLPLTQAAAQADEIMDAIQGKAKYIHAIQPAFTPTPPAMQPTFTSPQFVSAFQPPQYTSAFTQPNYCQSNSPPPLPVLAPIHHQPSPDIEHLQQQMNKITQMFTEFVGRSRTQAHRHTAQTVNGAKHLHDSAMMQIAHYRQTAAVQQHPQQTNSRNSTLAGGIINSVPQLANANHHAISPHPHHRIRETNHPSSSGNR